MPGAKLFPKLLARALRRFRCFRLRRHQQIEKALLGIALGAFGDFLQPLLANHVDRDIDQVANHRFHIAADVADLGELAGFHLQERRVGELREPARNLRLADAGRPDHEDVLRHHILGHLGIEFLAADAIAQRDSNGPLCVGLSDDVLIELANDLTRSEFIESGRVLEGLSWEINDHTAQFDGLVALLLITRAPR